MSPVRLSRRLQKSSSLKVLVICFRGVGARAALTSASTFFDHVVNFLLVGSSSGCWNQIIWMVFPSVPAAHLGMGRFKDWLRG
jgi:hypothetical protein